MKHLFIVLIFTLITVPTRADERSELDAMLEDEENSQELTYNLSTNDSGTTDDEVLGGKYKIHRVNRDVQFKYKGAKRSLIKWNEIKTDEWMNIEQWKKSRVRKDLESSWKQNLTERSLRELVGRFIDCIGDCRIYRGLGFSASQFNSSVRELDEVITQKDSYAWIAGMDGSLIRLSPNTSISFKEINIGMKENFIHMRINSGNVLLLNRRGAEFKLDKLRETDKIFLPLSLTEANPKKVNIKLDENDLSNFIEPDGAKEIFLKKLNKLILNNNKFIKGKPTYSMVIMPNGTILGENIQAEFIVLLGGESYVKQRSFSSQGTIQKEGTPGESELSYHYRGFSKKDSFKLETGVWYEVNPKGREIVPYDKAQKFTIGEYLTSNIPSIYMAREILLKRHSKFLFSESLDRKKMAENAGYRLWGNLHKEGDDLNLRIKFLLEYTRRIETTNLVVASQFRKKILERGELTSSMKYGREFYAKALESYIVTRESEIFVDTDREVLNSTKKAFWKIINGKTNR